MIIQIQRFWRRFKKNKEKDIILNFRKLNVLTGEIKSKLAEFYTVI